MLALYLAACHTPEAVTTVFKCSWGWAQKASETCRVLLQLLINQLPSCITLVLYIYYIIKRGGVPQFYCTIRHGMNNAKVTFLFAVSEWLTWRNAHCMRSRSCDIRSHKSCSLVTAIMHHTSLAINVSTPHCVAVSLGRVRRIRHVHVNVALRT